MHSLAAFSVGIVAIAAAPGCFYRPAGRILPPAPPPAAPQPDQVPSTPSEEQRETGAAETRDDFRQRVVRKLAEADRTIERLRNQVEQIEETARVRWSDKVAELTALRDMARVKLDDALRASEETWERLRDDAWHACEELELAVGRMTAAL